MMRRKIDMLHQEIEREIQETVKKYKDISFQNQKKVLESFIKHKVSDFHFAPSTGYGYGDVGREVLEKVFADVFGGEAALVRPHIVSGTHAISLCLFSILRSGDELIAVGKPYDTLCKVIDSLSDAGIQYKEVPLNVVFNQNFIEYLSEKTKVVFVQKSRGYQMRRTLNINEIKNIIEQVKNYKKEINIVVDNCYGEFVEQMEPCEVGADLTAGSLIKNPGGGLAPTGGYIVGREELVEMAADRLTAPGLGREVGSSMIDKRLLYQGIFMAPHVVLQALQSAIFASRLFEKLGYCVEPHYRDKRGDIIQTVSLESPEKLLKFCNVLQQNSPVDSIVKPEPALLPGYDVPVIMAAGTFVQGSSIELSADAPFKEPYVVYLQGGLTFESSKAIYLKIAEEISNL